MSKLKNVLSVSRRTDIPAYYLTWFIEKIKKGYVFVDNPFYPGNARKIELTTDINAWIVFWSRDYSTFLKHNDFFSDYDLYFHFTVNNENEITAPASIKTDIQIKQIEKLCSIFGSEKIMWRFDPLFFYSSGSNYTGKQFKLLCSQMNNAGVKKCVTSFAFPYKKIQTRIKKRNLDIEIINTDETSKLQIAREMLETAKNYKIQLYSCCDSDLLKIKGIKKSSCIDGNLLNSLGKSKVSTAKYPSREYCACTKSIDIGDYRKQACKSRCIYCYARPGD